MKSSFPIKQNKQTLYKKSVEATDDRLIVTHQECAKVRHKFVSKQGGKHPISLNNIHL